MFKHAREVNSKTYVVRHKWHMKQGLLKEKSSNKIHPLNERSPLSTAFKAAVATAPPVRIMPSTNPTCEEINPNERTCEI